MIKATITLTPEARAAMQNTSQRVFENAMADYLLKKYRAEVQAEQHLIDLCMMDTSWDFVTRRGFVKFAEQVNATRRE